MIACQTEVARSNSLISSKASSLLKAGVLLSCCIFLASGCSWFRSKEVYQDSVQDRPLEVPPDLNLPNSTSAASIPDAATSGKAAPGDVPPVVRQTAPAAVPAQAPVTAVVPAAAPVVADQPAAAVPATTTPVAAAPTSAATVSSDDGIDSFSADGSVDLVFDKVGATLAGIDGVTVKSAAQLLKSHDVSYQGQSFLIRIEAAGSSTRVSAIGADGLPLTGGASAALLAKLKAQLDK